MKEICFNCGKDLSIQIEYIIQKIKDKNHRFCSMVCYCEALTKSMNKKELKTWKEDCKLSTKEFMKKYKITFSSNTEGRK